MKEVNRGEREGREAGRLREERGLERGSIFQTFPKWDPGSFQKEAAPGLIGKFLLF